ncbi:MAG: tRNA 2-thiouridine(34) synthase MnmA [Bacteroidales bacterium]
MNKVVVGISGGVDSSVAAILLKEQGYDVEGLFMINWKDNNEGVLTSRCTWEDDLDIASIVAKQLDIKLHVVDFSEEYKKRVVDYLFAEYEAGRTPNPDVLCNREVKFDVLYEKAKELGANFVATGHYCRETSGTIDGKTYHQLLAGVDKNKDQSYFLCQLNQEQLSKALFPIGHLTKPEVRELAAKHGLSTAQRKDSQGICFIGKVDLPTFLQQKLSTNKGNVIEIPFAFAEKKQLGEFCEKDIKKFCSAFPYKPWNGKIIGEHNGAHFYTIGQRKGLNIGGHKEPLFIIATDAKRNIIYVGEGENHKGLYRQGLFIQKENVHLVRPDHAIQIDSNRKYLARVRYRQPLEDVTIYSKEDGYYLVFDKPQRGIASGQFAAWYDGDELIGSGVID